MSAPTAPTKTTLVTEALKRFYNGATPTSAEVTRGEDYGLEKAKRDIMNIGKTWRPLLKTCYDITVIGVSQYANPSDFEQNYSVGLMEGDHTGVLGTVTSTTVMALASDEDITKAQAEGKWLLITSGTGVDQAQVIDDYVVATVTATVASAFDTSPVLGDGYMVANSITPLRRMDLSLYDKYQHAGIAGTPKRYTNVPNATVGSLALYPVPDAVAGLQRRYYADLMLLDTSSTLYSTLLRRWAGVFEQGVYVWKLGEDDDRYAEQNAIYQSMLIATMALDLDGFNKQSYMKTTGGE